MKIIKEHWYGIVVGLIILAAFILRFYNYDTRWVLAQDQARDALIGREALSQHRIPVLGPFSQAGTFVMGPVWYWLVAAATAIYPNSVFTPWIVLTLSFVFIVYLMILIGREIEGKLFGVILGIIAAISSSQVAQSTNLTNPSGVSVFSALAVYFSIRYVKTGKSLFLFLFPFFIAIAANIHLQSIGLLSIILVALIIKRPNLKQLIFPIFGLVIPFIPLIIFDLNHNLYDYKSMLDYYLFGQYRIYIPNRWLTYLFDYWPSAWGYIVGGTKEVGYLIISLFSLTVIYLGVFKKKISKPMLSVLLPFLLILFMLRFYRGERFPAYILFTHPFIIVLSGWVILTLIKLNKILGAIVFGIVIVGGMSVNLQTIKNSTNHNAVIVNDWKNQLIKKYPNKKFAVYTLKGEYKSLALPLSLFLDVDNRINDKGMKIGIARFGKYEYQLISEDSDGFQLYNINGIQPNKLKTEWWFNANPSAIYSETEDWFIGRKF